MFTLNQALEAIKDKPEFSVKEKGDYTVIDYVFNDTKTFVGETEEQTTILLNLRGTAFDNTSGEIIRLGFHKFKNLGEDPEKDKLIDLSYRHVITQKLDGSCIFPIYSKNGIFYGTRAGVTDVSELAVAWINEDEIRKSDYSDFVSICHSKNWTPIFEFCSRKNRVVIDHPVTRLVLIGIREINTGKYLPYNDMVSYGRMFDIEVVKSYLSSNNEEFADFVKTISELQDDEGIVVKLEAGGMSGHMIKIKAAEYVRRHKAVDNLKFEKDCLLLALNNEIDDVYPILSPDLTNHIKDYLDDFWLCFDDKIRTILKEYEGVYDIPSRKDFAMSIKDNPHKSFLFSMKDGGDLFEMLILFCKKSCGTLASTKSLREFLGMTKEY